jgi:hypothetical protein
MIIHICSNNRPPESPALSLYRGYGKVKLINRVPCGSIGGKWRHKPLRQAGERWLAPASLPSRGLIKIRSGKPDAVEKVLYG